ncbi:MAG: metal-dependent hydrolase [Candidatus Aenigmarchaeota archaeon]|nr:metal-dependent hydrolase [Candidatus Aenigmarchaeota archaeon]
MFVFGHLGISLGIMLLISFLIKRKFDYRFVLIGALLSDFDKVIGFLLTDIHNGRIILHTVLFAGVMSILSALRKSKVLISLTSGIWIHLLLDQLWGDPQTLFWPLYGNFQPLQGFQLTDVLYNTITQPYNLGGEIAGLAVLIFFVVKYRLYIIKNLKEFVTKGRL